MRLDIDQSFASLYPDPDRFKSDLCQLQKHTSDREQYYNWARNLRFIAPAAEDNVKSSEQQQHDQSHQSVHNTTEVSNNETEDQSLDTSSTESLCSCNNLRLLFEHSDTSLMITPADTLPDCTHYVAVSWCWQSPKGPYGMPNASTKYVVVGPTGTRVSKVPSHILSRAISYADIHNVGLIWIDKECIDQDNRKDQEIGIQSMDLVYQRSGFPLGLLEAHIDTQEQMDILSLLNEGNNLLPEQLPSLLQVVTIFSHDPWFTRAWILQESVASGMAMTLLISHNPSLRKPVTFGIIPAEIEIAIWVLINMMGFAQYTVGLLHGRVNDSLEAEILQEIDKILAFNPGHFVPVLLPEETVTDPDYRQTCNAAQALSYLKPRHNSRIADRVAIMGNLCDYRIRLNTTAIDSLGYDFSICAFALALFNGDLSLTKSAQTSTRSPAIGYSWGPQQTTTLKDLDWVEENELPLRVGPTKFTSSGMLVRGWLWKVGSVLTDYDIDPRIPSLPTSRVSWELVEVSLLQALISHGLSDLAKAVYEWYPIGSHFRKPEEEHRRESSWTSPAKPLEDILDLETGELVFRLAGYVKAKEDLRALFLAHHQIKGTDVLTPVDFRCNNFWWLPKLLFLDRIIPLAHLVNEDKHEQKNVPKDILGAKTPPSNDSSIIHNPTAIFDVRASKSPQGTSIASERETLIFQPSTILDTRLSESHHICVLQNWVVELQPSKDPETGCRVINGMGELGAGIWNLPDGAEPELFLFT